MHVEIRPVDGLPEVAEGDDIAGLVAARTRLRDGDVVVVSQKVVSKAEGRVVTLDPGEDPAAARRRLGLAEAARVVVDSPGVLIVETRHGFVCANAGVDGSNIEVGHVVLLPVDPDASARKLREGLLARTGADVAVVVADTFGRPWRVGQTDVAIGLAGMPALRDERGGRDRAGNLLQVTEAAVADELAAAADLVRGKSDGVPVVVVRGFVRPAGEDSGARALVRPAAGDLFSRGKGALADALAGDLGAPSGAVDSPVLERALAGARRAAGRRADVRVLGGEPLRVAFVACEAGAAVDAGLAAGFLVAAATDLGLAAVARKPVQGEPGEVVVTLGNQ
jgi:coenzyme F420-0:L-glutamate ligase/coenzyme F420-1:gamma-L-glutamate ligase